MPPKTLNSSFQKLTLNGSLIYVSHEDDVYRVFDDNMNLIDEIDAPLEGIEFVEALIDTLVKKTKVSQ